VGVLNKVVAHFDEPFWPRDQYAFGCVGAPVDRFPTCVLNLWKTHRVPALAMNVGGPLARQVEQWSDADVYRWTAELLEMLFGAHVRAPCYVHRTQWQADQFAQGSYAYVAVNATPADFDILAEPIGDRLFFAGEATVRQHWATVHSAYVSGVREAARIARRRDILPPRHFTENRRWREMMQRANRFFILRGRALPESEMAERLAVLPLSPVFASVPATELELLATMFDTRAFSAGQTICAAGDKATEMFLITRGAARVELAGGAVASTLKRGDTFGEYGLFSAGIRTATVRAEEPTAAYVLDYERFQRFLLAFPESLAALMARTVKQLQEHEARASWPPPARRSNQP
jgi:hypothetical protein